MITPLARLVTAVSHAIDAMTSKEGAFRKAILILPFVYYTLFFSAFLQLEGLNALLARTTAFVPRFPLFWSDYIPYETVIVGVCIAFALLTLAASFFPFSRLARAGAFLGLLEYHALLSSFGSPNHQWDHWLWVLFVLIFLPTLKDADVSRKFTLVFWGAQAFLLLTYSMAGFGKLLYGLKQFSAGESSIFSPDSAALHVAGSLLNLHETVPFASFVVEHSFISWLVLLGIVYFQFVSIVVAFRPELHRLWGVGLVLFHLATLLSMRAVFVVPSALLLILLVSSPLASGDMRLRNVLEKLPLLGALIRLLRRMRTEA